LVEFTSIAWALATHGRGANLPYFGKQGNILPYSPREQKRKAIQGFPGVSDISEGGKEPNPGLFEIMSFQRPGYRRSPRETDF
jgi:hypothetical protein